MTITNYETKDQAFAAALPLSREHGFVFMIKWPTGEWTVEPNKPFFRAHNMEVIECRNGSLFCA